MRAGRFGSKAGRVAVVAAFVLGTLVVGTTAAGAADDLTTDQSTTIGEVVQTVVIGVEQTDATDWS